MAKANNKVTKLHEFLEKMETVPTEITKALLKFSKDANEKAIISAFAATLETQFKEMSKFIRYNAQQAPSTAIQDIEQLLNMSGIIQLIDNMNALLGMLDTIAGRLGVDGAVKEMKKVLKAIVGILFQGNPLPYFDELLTLMDEILNNMLSGESPKLKTLLSHCEVQYLNETTQLAKLRYASTRQTDDDNEE